MPSSDSQLEQIGQVELLKIWPQIAPMVESALKHGDGRVAERDIFDGVMNKVFTLWVTRKKRQIKAVCVTQIINSPRKRFLNLYLLSGENRSDWLPHEDTIAAYARAMGCEQLTIEFGRIAWERKLNDGWRKVAIVMVKDLTNNDKELSDGRRT